jgi:hypothetical protein
VTWQSRSISRSLRWTNTFHLPKRAQIAGDTDLAEKLATEALQIGTDCGQPRICCRSALPPTSISPWVDHRPVLLCRGRNFCGEGLSVEAMLTPPSYGAAVGLLRRVPAS